MRESLKLSLRPCWSLFFGLFLGFAIYFLNHSPWKSSDAVMTVALFVSSVLFSALILGGMFAVIISVVVYPLHYFLIRRTSTFILSIFFVAGILVGSFSLKYLLVLVKR